MGMELIEFYFSASITLIVAVAVIYSSYRLLQKLIQNYKRAKAERLAACEEYEHVLTQRSMLLGDAMDTRLLLSQHIKETKKQEEQTAQAINIAQQGVNSITLRQENNPEFTELNKQLKSELDSLNEFEQKISTQTTNEELRQFTFQLQERITASKQCISELIQKLYEIVQVDGQRNASVLQKPQPPSKKTREERMDVLPIVSTERNALFSQVGIHQLGAAVSSPFQRVLGDITTPRMG